MPAKKFCQLTILIVGGMLLCASITNYVVNPYGQYSHQYLRPMVQQSRREKVELLDQYDLPPEGLVLGSSRVLKVEPEFLRSLTGLEFFNSGVNYGKPEDFLAIYRRFVSRSGGPPEVVLVGLDPIALSDVQPVDARLIGHPELSPHVSDFIDLETRVDRWKELLSWTQTKDSLKTLKVHLLDGAPVVEESYAADGRIIYHRRERELSEGTYDFDAALDYNKNEYHHFYKQASQLSTARCRALEALLDQCQADGTQAVVFITPLHPDLRSHLAEVDHFEPFLKAAVDFARSATTSRHYEFVDLGDVAKFKGDPSQFVDGIHPLEPNTRRMMRTVFTAGVREEGFDAIQ